MVYGCVFLSAWLGMAVMIMLSKVGITLRALLIGGCVASGIITGLFWCLYSLMGGVV